MMHRLLSNVNTTLRPATALWFVWFAEEKGVAGRSAGVIQGIRPWGPAFSGGVGKVQEGLARQLRNARVRVPQQRDQHAEPTQLGGFNSDYRNGFGHVLCLSTFLVGRSGRFLNPPPSREDFQNRRVQDRRAQNSGARHDKNFVSAFLKDAEAIFQTARGSRDDCELAILVGRDGAIHMLAASGWELEPLRMHHGAKAAYRITRNAGAVRLEARSADEACLLQAKPVPPWRAALRDFPQYLTM